MLQKEVKEETFKGSLKSMENGMKSSNRGLLGMLKEKKNKQKIRGNQYPNNGQNFPKSINP